MCAQFRGSIYVSYTAWVYTMHCAFTRGAICAYVTRSWRAGAAYLIYILSTGCFMESIKGDYAIEGGTGGSEEMWLSGRFQASVFNRFALLSQIFEYGWLCANFSTWDVENQFWFRDIGTFKFTQSLVYLIILFVSFVFVFILCSLLMITTDSLSL